MARAALAAELPAVEAAWRRGGLEAVMDEPGMDARARAIGLPEFREDDSFVLDLYMLLRSELIDRAECMRMACDEAGIPAEARLEVARRVVMVEGAVSEHVRQEQAAERAAAEALRSIR